ncbi:MAG: putative selenium-dependent hydroxylase accessory protein YqeC [Eubacterium sp.]|nr:putative selenium-dependent hydroxylase accessory protein YqeC [Eubacterium sp.]
MKKNFFNHNLSSLLGLTDSHILTFIGGGGKTSLMNTLGIEFAKQRIPTLLTTTTHIMKPEFLPSKACIEEENLEQITSFFTNLEEDILPLAALGIPEKTIYNKVKWKSPSINFMKKLSLFSRKYSNISLRILCEGDGSKRLPIKLPKDGEPVFFPKTDTVIGVIGLSCLGKPIKEMLFRYELLPELIFTQKKKQLTDVSDQSSQTQKNFTKLPQTTHNITTDFLYWLCLSENELRKNISSEKFCIVFNQADVLDEKALAEMITLRNKIRDEGISCHILSLKNKYIIK